MEIKSKVRLNVTQLLINFTIYMSLFSSKTAVEAQNTLYTIISEETTADVRDFSEEHCILKRITISACTESPFAIRVVDFNSDCALDRYIGN